MHVKYQRKYEKGCYDIAKRVRAVLANKDNDVAVFPFVSSAR